MGGVLIEQAPWIRPVSRPRSAVPERRVEGFSAQRGERLARAQQIQRALNARWGVECRKVQPSGYCRTKVDLG